MPKINMGDIASPAPPKPPPYELSVQQADAISFVRDPLGGNAILVAVAGAGKTSTLVEMCKHIQGSAAFAAFNKKIADEIGRKLVDSGVKSSTVKSGTFHSFGFGAWRRVAPAFAVDGDKVRRLVEYHSVPRHLHTFVCKLVSLAKQTGVGVPRLAPNDYAVWLDLVEHFDLIEVLSRSLDESSISEEDLVADGIEWAQKALVWSIEQNHEIIDFDDMIFAPLYHGASFWQYDWMMIDEAQDTNPVRRELARRMLKPDGRLIAVGDPHQAIYGFTGADSNALDLIDEQFGCIRLPLTVSFRCAKSIVAHAQRWVSHIEAAPWAPEGTVRTLGVTEFKKQMSTIQPTDAILCRNTKPLVELAMTFLRMKIPAHVEGRDIGQSLLALVYRWKKVKTVADLIDRLEFYMRDEISRLHQKGLESKIQSVLDRVESLNVLMEELSADDDVKEVANLINRIFKDTEGNQKQSITLSTVHKAKGREWDRVWLFGRNTYMPSAFAKSLWQIEQEHNLIYVAVTRAKTELIEVEL